MIFHKILQSGVICLPYQLSWYFAWDGCQSRHPVVSWIIMFPFSEDCLIAAVFQSFGFPQRSEFHYDLMSAVIKCIWRKKVNDHGSHLPFPNNSVPFGPSSPPPEAPQACKPPLLLLAGWKVAALGSSLSSLKQEGEHVRTLKGYREKEKGKSTVVRSSSVPSPELLPVSLSDMRLVRGGGRSPLPPAAVETGCSVPAVESRSHRWSGEGTVQAGPRLCALLQFLKEMFSWPMVLCSSTTSKCCFQPYF